MDTEFQQTIDFAKKYNIKIKAKIHLEKHYKSGHPIIVYTIKVFRDKKYFTVKYFSKDLGFCENNYSYCDGLYNDLLNDVISRLPRRDFTYEEYLEYISAADEEEEEEISLLRYKAERQTYKKVVKLFPEILQESQQVTGVFFSDTPYIPSKQRGLQINVGPLI